MPTYDFQCPECWHVFEVFRPMDKAGDPAVCPNDGNEAQRLFGVAEAYLRDRVAITRAQVRKGDYWKRPGSITDHIITGDGGARFRETEKQLLTIAKENGLPANDSTLVLKGDRPRPRARGLISYPGRPARRQTRDEAKGGR